MGLDTLAAPRPGDGLLDQVEKTMARQDPDGLRVAFERLAGGDRRALAEVYDNCSNDLYGFALWKSGSPDDANDVVQEVFLRLAERGTRLNTVRRPRAYLLTMVSHACADVGRQRQRGADAPLPFFDLLEAESADPDSQLEAGRVSRRLATLPAAQREALYLRFFADLSYREIGRVCGVSTFTAASRCRLGLKRLQKQTGLKEK